MSADRYVHKGHDIYFIQSKEQNKTKQKNNKQTNKQKKNVKLVRGVLYICRVSSGGRRTQIFYQSTKTSVEKFCLSVLGGTCPFVPDVQSALLSTCIYVLFCFS